MWELDCEESWAPKNWCFWTVVLEKTLESPLDSWRYNQSILKEISSGCSLEGMMLKLKLQYFGYPTRRVDSLEKTLMLGGIGGRRRRGWQRMRWLDGITDLMDMSLSVNSGSWWWTGRPDVLRFMGSQSWTQLSDWTELNWCSPKREKTKVSGTEETISCSWSFPIIHFSFSDDRLRLPLAPQASPQQHLSSSLPHTTTLSLQWPQVLEND